MVARLSLAELRAAFPPGLAPRPSQAQALAFLAQHDGCALIEAPTGSGKTAVAHAAIGACLRQQLRPLFYVVPNRQLVGQVLAMLEADPALRGRTRAVYGRSEYPCVMGEFQAAGLAPTAHDVPCAALQRCPHRVDQQTGATHVAGAEPCPYLAAKHRAKQADVVVCTMAFAVVTQLLSREWGPPPLLILDEVHRLPDAVRSVLSYELTDRHLARANALLVRVGEYSTTAQEAAARLASFRSELRRVVGQLQPRTPTRIPSKDVTILALALQRIDPDGELPTIVAAAIEGGAVDPVAELDVVRQLEVLSRSLGRYVRSLLFSIPHEAHGRVVPPLSLVVATHERDADGESDSACRLAIRTYAVGPLVQRILGERTIALSATVGDPQVFSWESGITLPTLQLGSEFPDAHVRIYVPNDAPDLTYSRRHRKEPKRTIKRAVRAAARLLADGHRSLVVTVSDSERELVLNRAALDGVPAMSYGQPALLRTGAHAVAALDAGLALTCAGAAVEEATLDQGLSTDVPTRTRLDTGSSVIRTVSPLTPDAARRVRDAFDRAWERGLVVAPVTPNARQAAALFTAGLGGILVGTVAQFSVGLDLPRQTCPVIFFLRPPYPAPNDPQAEFEEERFGSSHAWMLRRWRALMTTLQVRGRNVRSATDVGVTILLSAQFRAFLPGGLPAWLRASYRDALPLEDSVADALQLLRDAPLPRGRPT